jgi:hypothetical protein
VRRDQRHRGAACGAVGNVATDAGHGLRGRGKFDKLASGPEVARAWRSASMVKVAWGRGFPSFR